MDAQGATTEQRVTACCGRLVDSLVLDVVNGYRCKCGATYWRMPKGVKKA